MVASVTAQAAGTPFYLWLPLGLFTLVLALLACHLIVWFRKPAVPAHAVVIARTAMNEPLSGMSMRSVDHDISLLEAINYVAIGVWGERDWYESNEPGHILNALTTAAMAVRQRARDGRLPVWGREWPHSGILNPIEPDYWADYEIDYEDLLKGDKEQLSTKAETHGGFVPPGVRHALQTSRAQVEALWPPKPQSELELWIGDDPPFTTTKYEGGIYSKLRTIHVGIHNAAGQKSISNIKIEVTDIDPWTGRHGPWVLKDGLAIAAGDTQYVPLVTHQEAEQENSGVATDSFIELAYKPKLGRTPTLPLTLSILKVKATGFDTAARESQFKIWADNKGIMRIAKF